MKIGIIGTYPPRQCGIATFSKDLYKSLQLQPGIVTSIVAVSDGSEGIFPPEVSVIIEKNKIVSYQRAAQSINDTFDGLIIQHEYGIFGGENGNYILELAQLVNIPIVTNFHTVLQHPRPEEFRVLCQLANISSRITVMTQTAVDMLIDLYNISFDKIELIPHGVPQFDYTQQEAKHNLGLSGKKVMLSFGFLGPSKGFETAIEAVASIPYDFIYIILGNTHPNILKEAGESYREYLKSKVETLGITSKVCFVDEFASETLLTQYLSACDIYVTPYPNEQQISSGTLAFAIGAGAAVVSTPYWYAKDLLKNERGLLFGFRDSKALAKIVSSLLENPVLLAKYRHNAAQYGAKMSWTNIGQLQHMLLKEIITSTKSQTLRRITLHNTFTHINKIVQTPTHKLSS